MPENVTFKAPTQELALVDCVERLDRLREGRIAIQINLSQLAPAYRQDNYIRIATETFAKNVNALGGNLFVMENGDIFFITKGIAETTLESIVARLRVLFGSDPLIQFEGGDRDMQFCAWYRFETDYDELLRMVHTYLKTAEQSRMKVDVDATSSMTPTDVVTPIRPEILGKLEAALERADITNVVRRQTVCTLFDNKTPQALFDEIFVSIEDLQTVATPGIDLLADRWLFQYLTRTLDRRMLMMLMRDKLREDRPFSLNLNIATVLSPEFMRFGEIIPQQLRGRLIIEMNKIDVFSDMGAFLFARDYLRDRGFRICLDGLTHHTLAYYDQMRLGFDLMKVYWTPDSIDKMLPDMVPTVRNIIMETGQARTILCRCESEQAVEIGRQLGIVMFQGRYVDKMLAAVRSAPPPPPQPPIIIRR